MLIEIQIFFYNCFLFFYLEKMVSSKFKSLSEKMNEDLQKIAFPRLTGTEGEIKAQNYLYNLLKRKNLPTTVETFEYENWTDKIKKYRGNIFSILLLVNIFIQLITNTILSIGFILFIWLGFQLWPNIQEKLIPKESKKKKKSKNISTHLNSKKNENFEMKMGLILLIAHYDSTGNKFASKCTSICENIIIYDMHLLSFVIILFKVYQSHFVNSNSFYFFIGIILLLSVLEIGTLTLLKANTLNNKSDGLKNNAMGIICFQALLEEILDKHDIFQWSDIKFLFPGAEEQGLYGKRSFFISQRNLLQSYKDIYVFDLKQMDQQMEYNSMSNILQQTKTKNEIDNIFKHHLSKMKCPLRKNKKKVPEFRFAKNLHGPNLNYFLITAPKKQNKIKLNFGKTEEKCSLSNYQIISDLKEFFYNTIFSLDKRIDDKIEAAE
ncbi:hypothetical protein WKT22_04560 [Candidatus Lokiarchaeum ossiferum]